MSTAKEEILTRIRNAQKLSHTPENYPVLRHYRQTSSVELSELRKLFIDRLIDYKADVKEATNTTLPTVLGDLFKTLHCQKICYAPGLSPDLFSNYSGYAYPDDTHHDPRSLNDIDAVVTGSHVSCAQTGTICLQANELCGRRALTLVPDRHICIVRLDSIVYGVPEMIAQLDPHSPITMISGPSATSDIELSRVEGVHGPRDLIVIIVD